MLVSDVMCVKTGDQAPPRSGVSRRRGPPSGPRFPPRREQASPDPDRAPAAQPTRHAPDPPV